MEAKKIVVDLNNAGFKLTRVNVDSISLSLASNEDVTLSRSEPSNIVLTRVPHLSDPKIFIFQNEVISGA